MAEATTSNEKLHEALELLNQAAKEKGAELRQMLAGKYESIKEVVAGAVEKPVAWADKQGRAAAAGAMHLEVQAAEKVKVAAATMDESAHQYPWHWIGGAAVIGMLIGLLICPRR